MSRRLVKCQQWNPGYNLANLWKYSTCFHPTIQRWRRRPVCRRKNDDHFFHLLPFFSFTHFNLRHIWNHDVFRMLSARVESKSVGKNFQLKISTKKEFMEMRVKIPTIIEFLLLSFFFFTDDLQNKNLIFL